MSKEITEEQRLKRNARAREKYKTKEYREYAAKRRKDPEIKRKRNESNARWRAKNKNYYKEYNIIYRKTEKFKKKQREYDNNKYKTNIEFALRKIISSTINRSLSAEKPCKLEKLLGYSIKELKEHLESQFEDWMTWDNHGKAVSTPKTTWHIDHIKPVNTFNITSYDCEDFKKCWALENLRPLDSYENVRRPKDGTDLT